MALRDWCPDNSSGSPLIALRTCATKAVLAPGRKPATPLMASCDRNAGFAVRKLGIHAAGRIEDQQDRAVGGVAGLGQRHHWQQASHEGDKTRVHNFCHGMPPSRLIVGLIARPCYRMSELAHSHLSGGRVMSRSVCQPTKIRDVMSPTDPTWTCRDVS